MLREINTLLQLKATFCTKGLLSKIKVFKIVILFWGIAVWLRMVKIISRMSGIILIFYECTDSTKINRPGHNIRMY